MRVEFEDLPALWQRNSATEPPVGDLLERVIERSRASDRVIRRRDLLETGLALLLVPFFAGVVILATATVSRVGAAILTVACLGIPLRLARARRHSGATHVDQPLTSFLAAERQRLLEQAGLLRSILWWYLLPLGVGCLLVYAGYQSWESTGGYAAVLVAVYGAIYYLNQRAVAKQILPRLAEVESLQRAVETDATEPENQ